MLMPAGNRKAWMGNEWATAHKLMLAQRVMLDRWQRRFPAAIHRPFVPRSIDWVFQSIRGAQGLLVRRNDFRVRDVEMLALRDRA